jgi:hypothetical protein
VVENGVLARRLTIWAAMRPANFSSPYTRSTRASAFSS